MPKPLASIDWERHDQLEAQGMKAKQIAAQLRVPPATLSQRKARRRLEQQAQAQSTPRPEDVHDDGMVEFEPLPDGYAAVIQPMREYTQAEDAALNESVRLFGFIGTIVRDQYGRIIDGNQRARVARELGTDCPYTLTPVTDDTHAMAMAESLNSARREYTREQREQIAASLRQRGESYRYIAEALHVSHTQARTDVREAQAKVESHFPSEPSPPPVITDEMETDFPPEPAITEAPTSPEPLAPENGHRIQGRDGKRYPDRQPKRSHGMKPTTSAADRHVATIINLLMTHAPQWDEKHWHAVLDVVQTLRSRHDAAPTSVSPS